MDAIVLLSEEDLIVVKNFDFVVFSPFDLTREEFLSVSTPRRLDQLKIIFDRFSPAVIRKLNGVLCEMTCGILIVTIIRDRGRTFRSTQLPESISDVVERTVAILAPTFISNIQIVTDQQKQPLEYIFTKKKLVANTSDIELRYLGKIIHRD
ncbi:unnamed protein product [Caenorhabditis sp. 36 PRJEB53466]|nr:unnamed protein product [Caenorhabditis sp. 36 PRJEB53466]